MSTEIDPQPPKKDWIPILPVPRKSLFDIILLVAEIFVGVALAVIAFFQWRVYTSQANIMQADTRPWIGIDVVDAGPFSYSDESIELRLSLRYVNAGRSPAINVREWSNLLPGKSGISYAAKQ